MLKKEIDTEKILNDTVITNKEIVLLINSYFSKDKKYFRNEVQTIAKKLHDIYGDNEVSEFLLEGFSSSCCVPQNSFNSILSEAIKRNDVYYAKRYINDDYANVEDEDYEREQDKKIILGILKEYLEGN